MLKKVPHTYVIVFFLIIIAAVSTWFVPGGEYAREVVKVDGSEKTIIVDGSFKNIENAPQTWQIFSAIFRGFVKQAEIIAFILIIGGAFWIMNQSKAIDVGIYSFLGFTKKLEYNKLLKFFGVQNIILLLIMLMFSAFGAIFGMSEETIAFIIIMVPLAISMGYDSITGVAMVFVAAGLGFAGAVLNPFTIGIAQGLSDLPLFSGFQYRIFSWFVINLFGLSFILFYANKVKKNPTKSLVYDDDAYWRQRAESHVEEIKYFTPKSAWFSFAAVSASLVLFSIFYPTTTLKIGVDFEMTFPALPVSTAIFVITSFFAVRKSVHFFNLNILFFTILFLIIGVMGYGWAIMEIATLFFAMGIAAGIAFNFSPNNIVKHFNDGVKDIFSAAMVVGLAGGIIIVLQEGKIIDTILHSLSGTMEGSGKLGAVSMMYVIQNLINVIIPSGSAKAALTMPIMAPFSDVIGLSRQATVMAYQFGDGFTNMITPTSGVLIAVIGVAKIPYEKWVKWVAPLMILLIILGFLLLIPTVTMELPGF